MKINNIYVCENLVLSHFVPNNVDLYCLHLYLYIVTRSVYRRNVSLKKENTLTTYKYLEFQKFLSIDVSSAQTGVQNNTT
jgi:hypothetical protein